MLRGKDLFDQVRESGDAFWWLGQASFIVRLGQDVILIDPYLDPRPDRRVPPLFAAADAAGVVTAVLCTHDHSDHIDPVAVPALARETDAVFVAPRAHRERMLALGATEGRLRLLNDAESAAIGGLRVEAVKAAHEFYDQTADGLFPHLGYVVEGNGKRVYHSGDCVWWDGLQARLKRWRFDAVMLPINGRDAARYASGCIGNMTYQEAADLAGGLAARLTVPMHYDMFAGNSADPAPFAEYVRVKYPGRAVWIGPHAERVAL
jgi:L-ascorbate 6-phosphate lactonase